MKNRPPTPPRRTPACSSSRAIPANALPSATPGAGSPMWGPCTTASPRPWSCPRWAITPSPSSTAPARRRPVRTWPGPSPSSLTTRTNWRWRRTATPCGAAPPGAGWRPIWAATARRPSAAGLCPARRGHHPVHGTQRVHWERPAHLRMRGYKRRDCQLADHGAAAGGSGGAGHPH